MSEESNTLRFVIKGNHEGHQVDMYLYDEDFKRVEDGGELVSLEVGAIQYAIALLHEHGVVPYQRPAGNAAQVGGNVSSGAQPQGFTCTEHGSKFIVDNTFEPGLKKCGIFEECTDITQRPSWAKDKPSQSKKDGKWFWNCKYKEWKN